MLAVQRYVEAHPGCRAIGCARTVGPHGSLRFGYRAIHRAAKANLIVRVATATGLFLYPANWKV